MFNSMIFGLIVYNYMSIALRTGMVIEFRIFGLDFEFLCMGLLPFCCIYYCIYCRSGLSTLLHFTCYILPVTFYLLHFTFSTSLFVFF